MFPARARALNIPIHTPRLSLEPLLAHHADALFVPLSDTRIYEWISPPPPKDLETLRRSWSLRESRLSPNGHEAWLNWAVRRKLDGAYVGRLDATVDAADVATNFGYIFSPQYWQQGYATECSRFIVEHLTRHAVREVRAYVTLGNAASERVLAKAGFVRTRVIPDNDEIRCVMHDDVEYIFRA